MREWADLREQLAAMSRAIVEARPDAPPASAAVLHQTLLTGFLGGIGVLDEARTYLGARDTRFVIAPGTPLQRRSPHWIVAASLVETQRLYARMVAQVQPSWIEAAGAHLVKRTYGEAEWDSKCGMAFAKETVSLYGRVLGSGRRVSFATVDPVAAQRMFVEEALVRRQPSMPFAFLDRNAATRARIERVESCLRRRDLLAGDDALVRFYLERIPPHLASTRTFEKWWRSVEQSSPHALDADESVFLLQPLPAVRASDYPASFDVQGNALRLHYHYDTAALDDGATLELPVPLLRAFDPRRLEWLIPGWLREKIIALLRGLPKEVRREIVPIPDAADRLLAALPEFGTGSLFDHVAAFVTQEAGIRIDPAQVAAVPLAPWLSFNFRVLDGAGRLLKASRDFASLRDELRSGAASAGFTPSAADFKWERVGVRQWDFDEWPVETTVRSGRLQLRAYPGIQDEGASVRLHLFTTEGGARRASRAGIVRLAALALPQQHELARRQAATEREFTLLVAAAGFGKDLLGEIADRAVADAVLGSTAALPRRRLQFEVLVDRGRADVVDRAAEIARVVKLVLTALKDVRAQLGQLNGAAFAAVRASVNDQLSELLAPGWVRDTPDGWWPQMPKYVRAIARRLERARGDVGRDRKLQAQVEPYANEVRRLKLAADLDLPATERERLRWMLEEFRLSLFAQELRTLLPASSKRLDEQLQLALREAAGATAVTAAPGRARR
jgi:ATP-dependent helicase HrpA